MMIEWPQHKCGSVMVSIHSAKPNENSEINIDIFIGHPSIWNITFWHKDRASIPQPVVIELDALENQENHKHYII
jgi:hypothetical protein